MSAPIEYGRNFLRPVSPVGPGVQSFKSLLKTGKGLRRPGVVKTFDANTGHGIVETSTLCSRRSESSPKLFSFLLSDVVTEELKSGHRRKNQEIRGGEIDVELEIDEKSRGLKPGIRVYFEVEGGRAARITRGNDKYDEKYGELIDFLVSSESVLHV